MAQPEDPLAPSTWQILQQGHYVNHQQQRNYIAEAANLAVAKTRLYTPENLEQLPGRLKRNALATVFETTRESSLVATRRLQQGRTKRIMCLNFASPMALPCFSNSSTQEGSLINGSALLPCLQTAEAFYKYHQTQHNSLYSDHMVYSPNVPFFKNDEGQLLDSPYYCSIITAAAASAGAINQLEPHNNRFIEQTMRVRIRKMLTLCAVQGYEYLVLGAWGCGQMKNNPEMMAELFSEKLTDHFAGCFRHIVFAIKTDNEQTFQPFNTRFNGTMYYLMY